ncbi:hypothetical protein OIDMADRAFT_184461 [Oidiodendron maius Zn]|uniref:Uncharacterized protein n=1 Tax=Oidiodendron maius (strain Zn) TaxID=913774 RepID=A0A0C3CXM0_OIDMZ|nr:hypothetical protein OIDMADRAFT_184461 [Oidiodendron maius Zn]
MLARVEGKVMSFKDIVAARAAHAKKQAIKDKKKHRRKRKNVELETDEQEQRQSRKRRVPRKRLSTAKQNVVERVRELDQSQVSQSRNHVEQMLRAPWRAPVAQIIKV